MKFQIRQDRNQFSGAPIFRVYQWDTERWVLKMGDSDIEVCRKYIELQRNPVPEIVIDEITITTP